VESLTPVVILRPHPPRRVGLPVPHRTGAWAGLTPESGLNWSGRD